MLKGAVVMTLSCLPSAYLPLRKREESRLAAALAANNLSQVRAVVYRSCIAILGSFSLGGVSFVK
jgi:hypothetical protein